MPILVAGALAHAGCAPSPEEGGFASPDPAAQIPAILNAVRDDDRSAVPHLVDALGSDDPAVRFMAQDALTQLTGTDRGYRFFDPPEIREQAIQRWIEFVRDHPTLGPTLHPTAPSASAEPPTTQ